MTNNKEEIHKELADIKSKVLEKVVRISIKTEDGKFEGREFIGRLMCIDKTKSVFLQDALEVIDREAPEYFDHELFTPQLIKVNDYNTHPRVNKMVGNVIIPGKSILRIELDKRLEKIYQENRQKQEEKAKESNDSQNSIEKQNENAPEEQKNSQ